MSKENVDMFKAKYGSTDHIDNALKSDDETIIKAATENKNFTRKYVKKILDSDNIDLKRHILNNDHITSEDINNELKKKPDYEDFGYLLYRHEKLPQKYMRAVMSGNDYRKQSDVMSNTSAGEEHIDKGVLSPDVNVRRSAISNPNINNDQLNILANDKYSSIKYAAKYELERRSFKSNN